MTPERWVQVRDLLNSALQLEPSRRSAYLDQHCSNDPSLRKDVDSFLAAEHELRSSFLGLPAVAQMARERNSSSTVFWAAGTKLGPYEIQSLLGAGGMGEVYRAHDPRLGREVAIKVLPRASISNPDRLRRFEQEARAAAALNHPNILAIYDIGTTDQAIPYVVSELLEGETLRECLRRGPLPVRKSVDLTLQITSGLGAAHAKGIIHRDLKPENLFLIGDGRLKILDFGLAKAIKGLGSSFVDSLPLSGHTEAGLVMGTVAYMSPEQVRGLAIDQRSDIFAVGAIAYEMLTGNRAFPGNTAADTINAILSRDPTPLSENNLALFPALVRVVQRCLDKNPNERFHSIRDVAFALEAISDLSVPTGARAAAWATRLASRRSRYLSSGLLAALTLCIAAVFLYYRTTIRPSATQEWEQLTSFPDSVTAPALSPDGHMLAFVRNSDTFVGRGDVYLKMLSHGEPVQLTNDDHLKTDPVFSLDGSRIAYTVAPSWDTWVVPTLGGKPQLMLPNASGLSWIDDRHILFSEIKTGVHMSVATATESRSEHRDIYIPTLQEGMAHRPYLSPDHKWVLVASEMDPVGYKPCRLVPFDGRLQGTIVGPPDAQCTYAAWSTDGKWMFFSANLGRGFHLWRERFPGGQPEQFTFGPTEQEGIAVAPDGRSLLSAVGLTTGTITLHDRLGERQISFEGQARFMATSYSMRAVFSPDGGKIYFLGRRIAGEAEELWVEDIASGLVERAVPGMSVSNSYDVSPDGKQIAFDSLDTQGNPHLWVASLDHREPPRRLGSAHPEAYPVFGPEGDLFFQSEESGDSYVYRRNLESGETRKALPIPIVRFQTISPDGKWVVVEAKVTNENVTRGLLAYRLSDGTAKRVCHNLCYTSWTQDGRNLHVVIFGTRGSSPDYKTFIVPLRSGESFPVLPARGIEGESDLTHLADVKVVSGLTYPGPDRFHYAISRMTVQRNIYRIPIQ